MLELPPIKKRGDWAVSGEEGEASLGESSISRLEYDMGRTGFTGKGV
jgi:hypothetical protein